MGLLERLRNHVAARSLDVPALETGKGLLHQHPHGGLQTFKPLRTLFLLRNRKASQFDLGRALARPEVASPVADQIEGRDPFGDPRGLIDVGRHLHDSMADAHVFGAGGAGGQEDLRSRRVRILLEEVMLRRPHVVIAVSIGEFDLLERVLEEPMLRIGSPGTWKLMFIEAADLHLDARPFAAVPAGPFGGMNLVRDGRDRYYQNDLRISKPK